jgi:hypothetical protein
VVNRASGRASLGCLLLVLLATVALYLGFNMGEVYWRYYQYRDAMEQEVRFASMRSDAAITGRLISVAESLGLPDAARPPKVQRDPSSRRILISAAYSERVELPGFVRTISFTPHAQGTY